MVGRFRRLRTLTSGQAAAALPITTIKSRRLITAPPSEKPTIGCWVVHHIENWSLRSPSGQFASPLVKAPPLRTSASLRKRPLAVTLKKHGSGRADCWVKVKDPNAPAVRREAEEDWSR